MTIRRGTNYSTRRNAKNFINEEAQRRLNETVKPFNKQVTNSLFVDAVECAYYSVQDNTGRPCSCQQQHTGGTPANENTNLHIDIPETKGSGGMFELMLQDTDFMGEQAERSKRSVLDVSGAKDTPVIAAEGDFEDGLFGANSVNCGICHRIGFQPGYQLHGQQRTLLTHYDIEDMRGFQLDRSEAPHIMRRLENTGYVEYRVAVPKVFRGVRFRIYVNHAAVPDDIYRKDHRKVDLNFLRDCAGHTAVIRVLREHTHVIVEFDLGLPPMRVNLSAEQKSIDYERLETINDMTVVMPPTLSDVNPRDIIIIPSRRLALKVNDKELKITADRRPLEWSVQTRVLQPTEHIRRIHDLRKVF